MKSETILTYKQKILHFSKHFIKVKVIIVVVIKSGPIKHWPVNINSYKL